ncbi:MAG: hypothetical protein FWD51_00030 [Betaproteobacteria bacterium]|nr:hypothetical protein [Betaproteobacteria bacterium]
MTLAIHINSTAPFTIRNKGRPYFIEDFDLLSTILSALMWREKNGHIKLYTDLTGYDHYASLDLLDLWDGGIDVAVVENIPDTINQQIFWAAAKIFALRNEAAPIAMIDTDLIVWKNLASELDTKKFVALHREELMDDWYLHSGLLKKRCDYQFDLKWDWTALPCNMALAYFSDEDFKKHYSDCSIDFMEGNCEYPMEMVSQMVFAEQRMVSMCAVKMNIPIHHLLDHPYQANNNHFTHIWGGKDVARNDPRQRKLLCTALLGKIEKHFPSYHKKICSLEALQQYHQPHISPVAFAAMPCFAGATPSM